MHATGNAEWSTFRRTLSAILAAPLDVTEADGARLTEWMRDHVAVIPLPCLDADALAVLEQAVLHLLDPPLNLAGMPDSETRARLRQLRARRTR